VSFNNELLPSDITSFYGIGGVAFESVIWPLHPQHHSNSDSSANLGMFRIDILLNEPVQIVFRYALTLLILIVATYIHFQFIDASSVHFLAIPVCQCAG
jgi:hypothetical protein